MYRFSIFLALLVSGCSYSHTSPDVGVLDASHDSAPEETDARSVFDGGTDAWAICVGRSAHSEYPVMERIPQVSTPDICVETTFVPADPCSGVGILLSGDICPLNPRAEAIFGCTDDTGWITSHPTVVFDLRDPSILCCAHERAACSVHPEGLILHDHACVSFCVDGFPSLPLQ